MILTGKNGSGKTSVLEAISQYLHAAVTSGRQETIYERFPDLSQDESEQLIVRERNVDRRWAYELMRKNGVFLKFSYPLPRLAYSFRKGQFILAYYKAERMFHADVPRHVEKVALKDSYMISEAPRQEFVKYLLDLKVTGALARNNGNIQKAE